MGGRGNFIEHWGALNFFLPLGVSGGFKIFRSIFFFFLEGGGNGQSLLRFVCLFQVKYNFSIKNIFCRVA